MTTLDHATLTLTAPSRAVRIARVKGVIANFFRAIRNRREIYRLGAMSDMELADIGLRRTDLHVAIRSPFGIDPTIVLGSTASGRASFGKEEAARRVC